MERVQAFKSMNGLVFATKSECLWDDLNECIENLQERISKGVQEFQDTAYAPSTDLTKEIFSVQFENEITSILAQIRVCARDFSIAYDADKKKNNNKIPF